MSKQHRGAPPENKTAAPSATGSGSQRRKQEATRQKYYSFDDLTAAIGYGTADLGEIVGRDLRRPFEAYGATGEGRGVFITQRMAPTAYEQRFANDGGGQP